ncbi:MAG: hypothetical protein LBE59_07785 [Nevskiaceae bacterium]|jgi:hypothetical protein|nr:hypothetical protein [Nevskiaceae bacterium]
MIQQGTDFDHPRRSLAQRAGAVLWPSFFAAGVGTVVLFALVDPVDLFDLIFPEAEISRGLGYSLGFFSLWIATFSSSVFTWILLRPSSRYNHPMRPG